MKAKAFLVACLVLLVGLIPLLNACLPDLMIEVTNNTSETLFVYVVYYPPVSGLEETVGYVDPGATIKRDLIRRSAQFLNQITVKAENSQGTIVYAGVFTAHEFLDADMKVAIGQLNSFLIER